MSPKACAGILRRAENRGKKLPDALYQALQAALTLNAGGGKLTHQSAANGHIVPCFWNGEQITQTLDAVRHKGQTMPEKNRFPAVLMPVAVPDVARTLNARHDSRPCVDRGMDVVAVRDTSPPVVAPTLDVDMAKKWGNNQWVNAWAPVLNEQARQAMQVRRLTVTECERLQGFPDDYTNIPGAKDAPRYKALGNSMAVPCMRWIGERICN